MFRLGQKLLQFQLVRRCYSVDVNALHGTLHLRFLEHLQQTQPIKIDPRLMNMIKIAREAPLASFQDLKRQRQLIDKECMKQLKTKRTRDIHGLLDLLIEVMPGNVALMSYFREAIHILVERFEANPYEMPFVKLAFYLGLLKKKLPGPEMLAQMVHKHLDDVIDNLSTVDFAIVCTAMYKASVKTESEKFAERLVKEITSPGRVDGSILVAFVKSLRINRINPPQVLEKFLQLHEEDQLKKLELPELIHLFAFIADNSIKNDKLIEAFIKCCLKKMNDESRAKDMQKLLYSCALLNFPISQEHMEKMNVLVVARTSHKEFQQKFDNFVDVALSMWMLNFRSRELIDILLKDNRLYSSGDPNRVKLDSKKKLLLTCIEIEDPEWLKHLPEKQPSFNPERQAPKYLINPILTKVLDHAKGRNAKIVQQINNLNIAGVLVTDRNGNHEHLEVLDNTNTLTDKKTPHGILALKLRLLKQLGCKVKLVSHQCNFIFLLMAHR